MKVTPIFAVASLACLLSISCHAASDLTRAQAKRAFDKIAAADDPTTVLTFSTSQMQRLEKLPKDTLEQVFTLVYAPPQGPFSFADLTNHPAQFVYGGRWCLPDPGDMRLMSGNFIQCKEYVGIDIDWQHPGVLMVLKNPIKWTVVEVTGITEGETPSEKVVDVTWQYDLSSFPQVLQDAIKQPLLKGKILFKLYDDGWRFEKLITFNSPDSLKL
jgi:hypothetical protein